MRWSRHPPVRIAGIRAKVGEEHERTTVLALVAKSNALRSAMPSASLRLKRECRAIARADG